MNKKIANTLLLLVLAMIVVGCSNSGNNSSSDDPLTIWATNINVPVLEAAAEVYQEEHPDFKVNIEEMNNDDIQQKVTTGFQAGGQGLPDAALIVDHDINGYVQSFSGNIVNLSEMGFDEYADQFPNYKIDSVSHNGDIYAFPFDAGPVGVFYRKDIFNEAGVSADDIVTWDDYIEAGKIIKEVTGVDMLSYDSNDFTVYTIILGQQGKGYFDESGNSTIDSEASLNAATIFSRMADEEILYGPSGWDAWVSSLSQGKTATAISGAWLIGTLQQQVPDLAGNWSVMPLPAIEEGGARSANSGGSSFIIFESSEQQQEIYDFLTFFSTDFDMQELAMEGGLFPSYLPVYESDLFSQPLAYFDNEPVWQFFSSEMEKIPSVFFTENDAIGRDEARKIQAEVVEGKDPQQAIEEAKSRIDNRLGQ